MTWTRRWAVRLRGLLTNNRKSSRPEVGRRGVVEGGSPPPDHDRVRRSHAGSSTAEKGNNMFAAIMTAAAVASVLAYMILGYIPRLLVAATVISFLVVVF